MRRQSSKIWDNEDKVLAAYASGKSISHIRRVFGGDDSTIAQFLRDRNVEVRGQGFYLEAARNPHYKGGSISRDGYRSIHVNGKNIFEHRKVMQDFLKRNLSINEHVHHLNGNKLDNRIENLAVLTPSAHGTISARQYSDWRKMYQCRIAELESLLETFHAQARRPVPLTTRQDSRPGVSTTFNPTNP